MKLLLTNDDGVNAAGILRLALILKEKHEIMIVAPDSERSGFSNAMTLGAPLKLNKVALPGLSDIPTYATSGTPVDCVKLALGQLRFVPDLVVSGINMGANLGTDAIYSGTVSSAMEGALNNLAGLAVSCCSKTPNYLETAAHYAKWAVEFMEAEGIAARTLISVNVPDIPLCDVKGIKVAPLSFQSFKRDFIEFSDPHGRRWYFSNSQRLPAPESPTYDDDWYVRGNYVAVTPITLDLTDFKKLESLKNAIEK
ncbi:MAG: 5'/3'-nucleotidase SurE [Clostridia bacterium]